MDLSTNNVAHVVAYLASDAAGDITGRIIHAAGGAFREYTTTHTFRDRISSHACERPSTLPPDH